MHSLVLCVVQVAMVWESLHAPNFSRNTPIGFDGIAYSYLQSFGQDLASGKRDETEDEQCTPLVLLLGGKQ
jgi:hypothetical protein